MIEKKCWICGKKFRVDYDLEKRLRDAEIVGFPALFYQLCPEHKKHGGLYMGKRIRGYGYESIEDAVAFRLVHSRIMAPDKRTGVLTETHLRSIGVSQKAMKRIRKEMEKYTKPKTK